MTLPGLLSRPRFNLMFRALILDYKAVNICRLFRSLQLKVESLQLEESSFLLEVSSLPLAVEGLQQIGHEFGWGQR